MRHFPAALSRTDSDALIDRLEDHIDAHGYGLWALERLDDDQLLGFVGLQTVPPELPFAPTTEIGWRLAHSAWGQGYATEAARAAVRFGFADAGLEEIVAFTTVGNTRSRAVMERLGMTRDAAEDFDHPGIATQSPLRRHVLYRIENSAISG